MIGMANRIYRSVNTRRTRSELNIEFLLVSQIHGEDQLQMMEGILVGWNLSFPLGTILTRMECSTQNSL